jgi:hypothetical protein
MTDGPIWYLDVAYNVSDVASEEEHIVDAVSGCNGFLHMATLTTDDIRELTFEFLDEASALFAQQRVFSVMAQHGITLLNIAALPGPPK